MCVRVYVCVCVCVCVHVCVCVCVCMCVRGTERERHVCSDLNTRSLHKPRRRPAWFKSNKSCSYLESQVQRVVSCWSARSWW